MMNGLVERLIDAEELPVEPAERTRMAATYEAQRVSRERLYAVPMSLEEPPQIIFGVGRGVGTCT